MTLTSNYAVNAVAFAAYCNSGQICMCADRIVVQRQVAEEVTSEEIFGPVCTVLVVDNDDEAIAAANASSYGLTTGVLTGDMRRGLDVARRLRTGIAHVNDQSVDDEPQAPFGGVSDSGYGRFGGRAAMGSFTELRWVTLRHGRHPFPL